MKHLGPTTRKAFMVALVVVMITVTFGVGVASASGPVPVDPHGMKLPQGWSICTYTVRPGDTLFGIAKRHNVTVWMLAAGNHIANVNFIRSGSRLLVPCGAPKLMPMPKKLGMHRVVRGETLSGIAVRHHTTTSMLANINHISNPSKIYAGQWLRVPCD